VVLYNSFFFGVLAFLAGITFASFHFGFWIVVVWGLLAFASFVFFILSKNKSAFVAIFLSPSLLLGALYFGVWESSYELAPIPFEKNIEAVGVISDQPSARGSVQNVDVEISEPFSGTIRVTTNLLSRMEYGDVVGIQGTIQKEPQGEFAYYLKKEGVNGTMYFPEIEHLGSGEGSTVQSMLFSLKDYAVQSIHKILPHTEAAFLSGLLLGERSEFPEEFEESMRISGTTHLVALSGYNITILISLALSLLGLLFSRRASVFLACLCVFGFIIMTGADPSTVRAGIMGLIILVSERFTGSKSLRNVIAFTAFCMTLINPYILVFDVGFQLSFLALLGIVYLAPAVRKHLRFFQSPGMFSWKDNALNTASAQILVLPILSVHFGEFSPLAIFSNVLILELVPVTMALGFLSVFFSLFSQTLSLITGWITLVFLRFEEFVIRVFAIRNPVLSFELGGIFAFLYYAALSIFVYRSYEKKNS